MNKFKSYILMAAGFAVLAAFISGVTAGPAIAQLVKAALIKNVDEPGRVPFQKTFTCQGSNGCFFSLATVPANKRLVAQYVSLVISNADAAPLVTIAGTSPGSPETSPFAGFPAANVGQAYVVSQVITLFFESGSLPSVSIKGSGNGFAVVGNVSGYLVDLTL